MSHNRHRRLEPYPKWSGLIMAFILNGSTHFLTEERGTGVAFLLSIFILATLGPILMVIPGLAFLLLGVACLLLALGVWIIMLSQSYREAGPIGCLGWITLILISGVLNWGSVAITGIFVASYTNNSGSMEPTLFGGDRVLVSKRAYWKSEPLRGDLVVFSTDGLEHTKLKTNAVFVKRVAGMPLEQIRIRPPELLANDQVVVAPPFFGTMAAESNGLSGFLMPDTITETFLSAPTSTVQLLQDQFFMLGDNQPASLDSRFFGPVNRDQFLGRAVRVWWPFYRIREFTRDEAAAKNKFRLREKSRSKKPEEEPQFPMDQL